MADTRLPAIHTLHVASPGAEEEKQKQTRSRNNVEKQASAFLSRLQLGYLQPMPKPGDIFHSSFLSPRQPRPLGLIPGRNDRMAALKKLNQLLSPWSVGQPSYLLPSVMDQNAHAEPEHPLTHDQAPSVTEEAIVGAISATIRPAKTLADSPPPKPLLEPSTEPTAYRLTSKGLPNTAAAPGVNVDPDYMGDKASQYYALLGEAPLPTPKPTNKTSLLPTALPLQNQRPLKQAKLKAHFHSPVSSLQYVNFTGQAHLFQRSLTEDKREALGYEPCERCRLRGGRCARCKALRTGGGYIILDAGDNSDWASKGRRKGFGMLAALGFSWSGGIHAGDEGKRRERRIKGDSMAQSEDGARRSELEDGIGQDGVNHMTGRGGAERHWRSDGIWEGKDGVGRDGGPGGRSMGDGDGGWSRPGEQGEAGRRAGTQAQRHTSARKDGEGLGGRDGGDAILSHNNLAHQDAYGDIEDSTSGLPSSDHMGEDSGRQSHASRSESRGGRSRPGSKLGNRPGSSLRQSGRGLDRKRGLAITTEEEGGRRGRQRKSKSREDESEEEDEEGGRRRRGTAKKRGAGADQNNGRGDYKGSEFKFKHDGEEDDSNKQGYHGNLRKFKRKRDDVKALHATMKELQGIDPLDYLARYCIIDQSKVPHYQHVYNNVDRDEDDEIDIGELDFALKAVNYDLISDSEMNYVHSVLELAGRYKLNFRLFSLIAALSEKVVALEDMVKRLINKMDFDALEVKMKKCKELFYLLADADAASEHEGGVVTTGSLAVELQAGGLTHEHVEFVVDRLNHEGKGLVEFLDYLTYVPLFVEIHDSISGNPLDFTRTK